MPLTAPAPDTKATNRRPVYIAVVNLVRASDRRAIMLSQLDSLGLHAEFPQGVDASEQAFEPMLDHLPAEGPWGRFGAHDKGCTLSHLQILRHFLTLDSPFCLVLEDDLFLAKDLPTWLENMDWWPDGADIVKIERWRDNRLILVLGRSKLHVLGREIAQLFSRHSGGGGYIVSRDAAAKIVNFAPVNMPIDHLLFNSNISALSRGLMRFQVSPAPSVQGNEPSLDKTAPTAAEKSRKKRGIMRKIRRGWHEIKVMPGQLALLLFGKAHLAKVLYQYDISMVPEK